MTKKSEEALEQITKLVTNLGNQLSGFEDRVSKLETKPTVEVKEVAPIPPDDSPEPVPTEVRESVNLILNKHFKVTLDSRETPGAIGFNVYVPKKYSNASESHWGHYKEDRRFRAIPRAEGIEGIKQYIKLVWSNLSQEAKTQVEIDREKDSI